ncbi:alpha-N-arabinofuranosidase [Flaviramulus sp. BrNp1-15]|uniref:alpha-N-arabinofuranosidase n=1 Tax=Flaviramulus sp. BrNp1-15 TaxID=2916754 RepID=UPI001EE90F3F|nr:alpha-L-arabinofuranosidase C-terminal domain-containing protein [Flaviramulus sp. BrNp1-15]ULC60727.1 alpha-N-arabinofuranosidase [Flaviramulus sp. BrNp1-15]
MKTKIIPFVFLISCFTLAQNVKITILESEAKDTISKHIYGHFAEHLGRCIYDGIYVGEENKVIPNTNGVRNDIIKALKELQIPNLRWPGGCFADIYHWKDAIGPKEDRKHIENLSWGNIRENNAFGTHEFLDLCEQLGAEPYLAVNMNSGTVQEAMEWEQYVNNENGASSLTDLRAKNGRDKPWKVKYWGIGNESWDCGGHMTADYYVNLYKRYATAMTSYSNTEKLYRIAVGPGTDDYEWTETVMKNIPARRIEGLSVHHYSVFDWSSKGSSFEFSDNEYYKTMKRAWFMEEFITKNSEIMDKYDPEKNVGLIVDEWGGWYETIPSGGGQLYQQNTIRDAMIAGLSLNVFNNHADRVHMANLAQTVNVLQAVILTKDEKMILTPTYHVMNMYKVHQDALLLPTTIENNPDYNGIAAISVSASKSENGTKHISLVNIDLIKSHDITIDIDDISNVSAQILTSKKVQDHNTFENPESIKPINFKDFKVKNGKITVKVPPISVIVFKGK